MYWSCPFFSRQNLSPNWGPLSIPHDLRSLIRVHLIYAETWQPRLGDCLQFQGLSPYRGLSRTLFYMKLSGYFALLSNAFFSIAHVLSFIKIDYGTLKSSQMEDFMQTNNPSPY